jgi:hypothetical protein
MSDRSSNPWFHFIVGAAFVLHKFSLLIMLLNLRLLERVKLLLVHEIYLLFKYCNNKTYCIKISSTLQAILLTLASASVSASRF